MGELLEQADAISSDCFAAAAGKLHTAVMSGVKSGTPGKPFPKDLQQRDRSQQVAESFPPGTPTHRFYFSLVKSAQSSIHWSTQCDEEAF